MSTSSFAVNTLKFLLVAGLLFCFKTGAAQEKYDQIVYKIDSLANIGLPKSALKEVDRLDALARKDHNAPQQIRAAVYRMTFQSYLEENALTAIISRLKKDAELAEYPVKPVLQSLLAQMYWNYYQQNRYQFTQRTRLMKPDTDFTKWDLRTIISETSRLYDLSLHDAAKEQNTPIGVLDGVLEGDKSTRYLRPTLYDLLVQHAFDFFLTDESDLPKPRLPFSLNDPRFFGGSRAFAGLVVKTTDTASTAYRGIKYLQQATTFHLAHGNQEALADLDLQRLKFLYSHSHVGHKDSLYLSALKQIAADFSAKPISSEALVLEGQYYQGLDSLTIAHSFFKQAIEKYPESLSGKNAKQLLTQIELKLLHASVEDLNVPGKPVLALIGYKNILAAKVDIYKLSEKQFASYDASFNASYSPNEQSKAKLDYLLKLRPIQTKSLKWGNLGDYRNHSLEFKIDALPSGHYVLLLRDSSENVTPLWGLSEFRVNRLAYTTRVNPDDQVEVRTMDRETGQPLQGVKIHLQREEYNYNSTTKKNEWNYINTDGVSDRNGSFTTDKISSGQTSVNLVFKGDTLKDQQKYINGATDRSDDDDPEDKTILFTDRQIYRPGQTIYFKALQLQTYKGKSKIKPDTVIEVKLEDINGKQVSSLKLKTNEFGTFSSSFIIPQSMLNGNVVLKTTDGFIIARVEEYKRPTFQVEFLPVKESYKLNDSITLKGTVLAFSGYGLSQAKVAYHIVRSQNRIWMNESRGRAIYSSRYNPASTEIKADTIATDDQGRYEIKFKALPGDENTGKNGIFTYTVNADVTDASGETRSATTALVVGNNDIEIESYLPEIIFAKDSINVPVNIRNLNGQQQKGEIKVEVFALKNPGQVFKNRLWSAPDQSMIGEQEFKSDFPEYAYKNEDDIRSWPKLNKVVDLNIKVNDDAPGIIKLEALRKQESGMYEVIIHARNEKGDTTSLIKFVNLIHKQPQPANFQGWVIPVVNYVKPGNAASFLVGVGPKIHVLMEQYHGAKLVSSKWIVIEKGQQEIKIPIADTDKDVAVQFMMIYQNRMYASYQKIYISDPDKTLDIKFLTFRNKLQPGEKEQWKLQVSDPKGDKYAAEMLASLYDASLDDITPPENWKDAFNEAGKYQPNYFAWVDYDFIRPINTSPIYYLQNTFNLITRNYEQLNLLGYNYYGGYNNAYQSYLQRAKRNVAVTDDKLLNENYKKNAALIKNGYDITGSVIASSDKFHLPGVTVGIKGTNISTFTNSNGNFKIKVPLNGVLIFSYIGYDSQEIPTSKSDNITVTLKENASMLNEVVVVGYGIQRKADVAGAVVTVRAEGRDVLKSLEGKAAGVYVTNAGAPGADNKVFIRGISGGNDASKPIALRTNFAETAFFYPQLHTDDKGGILIDFTIPEALTRWKFRALAHTKDLKTGYIENTVVTQKQLSISANTPRFLREGDTITVSARLANLTADKLKGAVQMKLFNTLNMQPVSLFVNSGDASQSFEIAGGNNKAVSFKLVIPAGLDALTYRLTADAGQFTDGEENTLPVLPNRMLVTESMPMMVRAGQTRDFTFDKLVNQTSTTLKNKTLTLEYTQNPAWYAVQALPYMMEFPYECSEQIFSRYYANSLATSIVTKTPAIKQVFDQWKSADSGELLSNLEKNQELKTTLIEETPWLKDAENETEQKKRIALLFDLNKMSDELKLNFEKLQKRQLPDGGFTWFGGDRSDRYISQHIAEGIGELYHINIGTDQPGLKQVADDLIRYLDGQILQDEKDRVKSKDPKWRYSDIDIHAWFTRSYFLDKPLSHDLETARDGYLKWAADEWKFRNVYEQGMIALTMQRYGKPAVTLQIERSLLETAQQSDDLGMYWAANRQGYFWYESPIETQSLLIGLFTEAGNNAKAVDEMKIWLLRNKQTNDWKTTKATAAACYALLLKGANLLADTGRSVITLGGQPLEQLKPDVKADAGTGYIKTSWVDEQIKPDLGKVEIKNNGANISWGALHWQYLENLDKVTSSETNLKLERKYFIQKQTDAGLVLTAVDATHLPKTGDLLKVVVYLKADRDFEYVQLKDMRPAGTEPVDALSTYKYQDGLYYYQVTKDVATNFFISYLNKGSYVFEYQLRVAQPGNFSTGITSIQCMYAPEFNAHSQGNRMTIK
jgi:uncharacterized protein YfaS (alpha-2-macroglobulin family)